MPRKDASDMEQLLGAVVGLLLIGIIVGSVLGILAFGLAWAWNTALVPLAHVPAISSLQAFAVLFLLWLVKATLTFRRPK